MNTPTLLTPTPTGKIIDTSQFTEESIDPVVDEMYRKYQVVCRKSHRALLHDMYPTAKQFEQFSLILSKGLLKGESYFTRNETITGLIRRSVTLGDSRFSYHAYPNTKHAFFNLSGESSEKRITITMHGSNDCFFGIRTKHIDFTIYGDAGAYPFNLSKHVTAHVHGTVGYSGLQDCQYVTLYGHGRIEAEFMFDEKSTNNLIYCAYEDDCAQLQERNNKFGNKNKVMLLE